MQKFVTLGLCFYYLTYVFEGVVRYGLNLVGMDALIFVRDIALMLPVALLGAQQFFARKIHPAYLVFLIIVLLHGAVFVLNFGLVAPAIFGAKVLFALLAGAIAARQILLPSRRLLTFFFILWLSTFVGVALDKFGITFPWVGMRTVIGDVEVDVGRDWQIEKDSSDYRAGGFSRSSIHVANLMPLLAFVLIFNLRRLALVLLVGGLTLPVIYWTTQKGALLAYGIGLGLILLSRHQHNTALKLGLLFFLLLSIALPVLLPGHYDAATDTIAGFSNMSFNLRVEMMWPEAWTWINKHDMFPFGVGLGGISSAQQIYALDEINAADNLFVFLYAYFGYMSLAYLFWVSKVSCLAPPSKPNNLSLVILFFIAGYGCVLSMIDSAMASLYIGAAMSWLGYERFAATSPAVGLPETKPRNLSSSGFSA